MVELIERLRARQLNDVLGLHRQAADALEAAEARIAQLEAALRELRAIIKPGQLHWEGVDIGTHLDAALQNAGGSGD